MRTATALTLVAIGAILAFAVNAEPPGFSFHVAGWVLMLTGVAGVVLPRRGYSWLRRRVVLSRPDRSARIERRQRPFSRMLVPGGVITEQREGATVDAPVEKETIEQVIEE
jgi:hypothetical protein